MDLTRLLASRSVRYFLLFIFSWLGVIQIGYSQDIRVTGKVTDETNQALQAAAVQVKGTAIGTLTDKNGNFIIETSSNSTLVISYLGYASQEIALEGRSNINVSMKEDVASCSLLLPW